ncbi:MAG TPA: hypothetical protein H9698_00740 [Candidatus Ruthenibacterium merdavium]|uniref:Uncharacterized protein n=1 Tax=Candidatus Ruthenibacterium merdavium TaxID=2838752 RepID=A0A9D2TK02_9FIRM|nr:hypothetical protein [Candidatus Ruthenibacterium merdavium]
MLRWITNKRNCCYFRKTKFICSVPAGSSKEESFVLSPETVEKLPPDSERTWAARGKRLGKGGYPSFPFEIGTQFVKKRSFFDKLRGKLRAFPFLFIKKFLQTKPQKSRCESKSAGRKKSFTK